MQIYTITHLDQLLFLSIQHFSPLFDHVAVQVQEPWDVQRHSILEKVGVAR